MLVGNLRRVSNLQRTAEPYKSTPPDTEYAHLHKSYIPTDRRIPTMMDRKTFPPKRNQNTENARDNISPRTPRSKAE